MLPYISFHNTIPIQYCVIQKVYSRCWNGWPVSPFAGWPVHQLKPANRATG